jgi:hypothetical protein
MNVAVQFPKIDKSCEDFLDSGLAAKGPDAMVVAACRAESLR